MSFSRRPAAFASVAWVVVVNKPLYPLWIGWLVGEGAAASLLTMATTPLYLLIALKAATAPRLCWLLPVLGAADAFIGTKALGVGAAMEAYLAPCAMLAALAGSASDKARTRALFVLLFAAFVLLRLWRPESLAVLSIQATERLRDLNLFSVAGLMFFIGWRFADSDEAISQKRDPA
jgi:hypothetical protein